MRKYLRHLALYSGIISLSLLTLLAILAFGTQNNSTSSLPTNETHWLAVFGQELSKNLNAPITTLLLQILIVLSATRLCALVFRKFGQTQVIAEIFAGIILGKSVFALLWPAGFAYVFPDNSMPRLYFLSQMGLIFFMFVVGLELNLESIRKRASTAILVSHVSIVLPFILGSALSVWLYKDYVPQGIAFSSFALFMGIAMSITAFPVLARIIKEKGLNGTPLGSMALTCAAVDDVTAWCILAAVIGVIKAGSIATAASVLALSLGYMFAMLKIMRPLIARLLRPKLDGTFQRDQFATVFITVLGSAFIAEVIGIHALFGAFLAGTIMPSTVSFRENLIQRVEDLSSVTLLPLFFAFTGIRTQIGLLSNPETWAICCVIIVVAVIGKLLGSALAARWSGLTWRDSLALGTLMNTRGLMELVVLNIGYDLGILSPTIFTMMVVMALVTTVMTAPLLGIFLPNLSQETDQALKSA